MAYNALSKTIGWAQQFNFNRNLALGSGNEPAVTSANLVKQTILGPPFAWPWNRDTVTFSCVIGQQDYPEASADFSWIEHASVKDTISTPNKYQDLQVQLRIPLDSNQSLPMHVAAQMDDGAGNITFRLQPVPDQTYPVSITVQEACVDFAATTDTWGPIPNRYAYIYNWGFLALMFLYADDPRFASANQKFVANLLGAAQGLTETQINIFLNNWQQITGAELTNIERLKQGVTARGV